MLIPRGATGYKVQQAREMRRKPTAAESLLWFSLRRRGLAGLRFRRQHVVAGYIVDFYCPAVRLAVEIDGGVHDDSLRRDAERDAQLAEVGVKVLRFRNERVFEDLIAVLHDIAVACTRLAEGRELPLD